MPSDTAAPVAGQRPSGARRAVSRRSAAAGRPLTPVLVGLLAAFLAVVNSGHVSLWTDEAATVSATTRTIPQLLAMLRRLDAVHGLFYAGMHPWVDLVGTGPFALRLPSAVAAGVTAAGVVVLARALLGSRAGLAAGLVSAGLPRLTWAGIEARSYVWTAAAAVWLTVLLIRAAFPRRRTGAARTWPWWAGYAVLGGVAVSLNVYLALLVVAHGVSLVADRSVGARARWRWLAAAVVAGVLAAPVLLTAAGQTGQLGRVEPGLVGLARQAVVNQFFLGETPSGSAGFAGPALIRLWAPAAVLLALVAWVTVLVAVVRGVVLHRRAEHRRMVEQGESGRGAGAVGGDGRALAVLVPWIVLPTAVIAGYAVVSSPVYSPRYLTFAAPAVAVLLGGAVVRVRRRWLQVALPVVLVVLAVPVYVSQRGVNAKSGNDWSQVAAVLARHGADSAVYFTPKRAQKSGPIVLTNRFAEVAYPDAYRGLRDITLAAGAVPTDSLYNRSRPLADSLGRLDGIRTVWVLRRDDYPAGAARADDALLERAGFRPDPVRPLFRGPLTTVLRFGRR